LVRIPSEAGIQRQPRSTNWKRKKVGILQGGKKERLLGLNRVQLPQGASRSNEKRRWLPEGRNKKLILKKEKKQMLWEKR